MTAAPTVSGGNSTSTVLGADETYTGHWEITDHEHVAVNVLTDQSGTLYVDFGVKNSAGTIVVMFTAERAIYANQAYFRSLVKLPGRYMRVRYVNDSVAQGTFTLHTCYGNNLFPVSSSDDNELLITETERERDVFVAYQAAEVSATTYALLIDLSDTTTWPHDRTGRIDLTAVYFSIDRDSTATGSVRVGVVTRIDGTDADVTWVQGVTFEKSNDRSILRDRRYSPSQIKCGVSGGATTRVLSDFTSSSVTAINTGTTLDSPAGNVTPAVGDIVMAFERSAGSYNAAVSCTYHGEVSA